MPPSVLSTEQYSATFLAHDGITNMRITLVGSRHFGVSTLDMLRQHDVEVVRVVRDRPPEDRLAAAAPCGRNRGHLQADTSW